MKTVISFANLKARLNQQYDTDYEYLEKNYAEQDKLRAAVLRYQDLEREAKVRRERAASIIVVLGEDKFKEREPSSRSDAKGIFFDTENMPLWALMRAVVEQIDEIQVSDLQEALEYFKKKASRQAIESALASHKDVFETKTRNRNKFVSLKR